MKFVRKLLTAVLLAVTSTLAFPMVAHAAPAACERPTRLRFAVVPQGEEDEQRATMAPLLKELEGVLGMPVEIAMPSSYGAVIEGLLAGAIDIARLGPASYVTARRGDASITPFASLVIEEPNFAQGGVSSVYYSLLITRQQGPYDSVASLRGKVLALVDPDSTSGSLIPRHVFARQNSLDLNRYFSRIGYTGNHERSALSVLNRNVDAAFVASSNLSRLMTEGKVKRKDFRVLWRSAPIPFDPFVYRGHLCPDIRNKIRKVFFNSHSAQVAETLRSLQAVRFVPAKDADYKIIHDLP